MTRQRELRCAGLTYAERLAEFVKVTGHKPGEMNKISGYPPGSSVVEQRANGESRETRRYAGSSPVQGGKSSVVVCDCRALSYEPHLTWCRLGNKVSLEPARQSAGPGRCNRFTRAVALGDPTPCKLPANHEGPHEP